jgi:hypothetical protein
MAEPHIETDIRLHHEKLFDRAGMLTGFERHGATFSMTVELPEHMTDRCLREAGEMIERWTKEARGEK